MAITLTTVDNSAAVAKTFTEIAKDRNSSEWVNTSDTTASKDSRLQIKQSIIGKNKAGVSIRRSLVQHRISVPTSTPGVMEEVTVNITLTAPVQTTVLTATDCADAAAFVRNVMSGANIAALRRGEV